MIWIRLALMLYFFMVAHKAARLALCFRLSVTLEVKRREQVI